MKKSIFLFFAAILCATSAWAGISGYYIYFEKPSSWTSATTQFMVGHSGWSAGYKMTAIANTSLYQIKMTDAWDDYTEYAFFNTADVWGGEGNKIDNRKSWADHSSSTFKKSTTALKKYHLFNTTKSIKSSTSSYSTAVNRTQTIKVQLKDGSNWVDATVVPADLTASTYALTSETAAGAKSASLAKESTTVSATVSAAYSAKVTLSCTNVLDGYVFEGWYDANGNKITSYTVSDAHTVYARFIQSAEETNEVTVTYMCGTTSVATAIAEFVGVETEKSFTAPTVTGYNFTGWTVGAGMTLKAGTENDATITVVTKSSSSDYTLVANYEEVLETVYFINTGKWSDVYLHLWNGNATGTEWPGTQLTATGEKIGDYDVYSYTAKQGDHTNLLFHKKDDDSKKTGDLTWTAGKYYIYNYDGKSDWYTYAEADALLNVIPDYYITGNKELVGGEGWKANEVEMTYDNALSIYSHTFSASALTTGTEYKLKVTDGTWDNHWGTINGTIEGVSNDADGNVCFKLSTVGDVTVTFDGAKVTLSTTGAFYVPVVYDYYIAGPLAGGWSATQMGLEKVAEGQYACEFTKDAGDYQFKVTNGKWGNETGGFDCADVEGAYEEVSNVDGNVNVKLTATTTFTVKFDSNTKKISFKGLTPAETKYYIAGTQNLTGFDWKENGLQLTKDGDLYKHTFSALPAGVFEFKVTNGTWTNPWGYSNLGAAYKEVSEGTDGEGNPNGNIKFVTEEAKNITVIFDPATGKITFNGLTVITYVLMGVDGDWTTGIQLTKNSETEYMLLGQTITRNTDKIKVVTLTNGTATAWCGNVDTYSDAIYENDWDDAGNIVLEDGIYDFYFKLNDVNDADDDQIYIDQTTLLRTGSNKYGTIYIPYTPASVSGATFYQVAGKEEGKVYLESVNTVEAGKPYIYERTGNQVVKIEFSGAKATNGGAVNGLVGTDVKYTVVAPGHYLLYNNAFCKSDGSSKVRGYRAYLVMEDIVGGAPTQMPGRRYIGMSTKGENEATGFENITAPADKAVKAIVNGQLIIIRGGEMYNAQGVRL